MINFSLKSERKILVKLNFGLRFRVQCYTKFSMNQSASNVVWCSSILSKVIKLYKYNLSTFWIRFLARIWRLKNNTIAYFQHNKNLTFNIRRSKYYYSIDQVASTISPKSVRPLNYCWLNLPLEETLKLWMRVCVCVWVRVWVFDEESER